MRKEELLEKIDKMIRVEEEAIPIYIRHLDTILDWTGLKEKEVKRVHELLHQLTNDSKRHKKLFDGIKNAVASGGRDVY